MASLLLKGFFLLAPLFSASSAAGVDNNPNPHALVLPATKDPATLQYVTRITQRTPLVPLPFVVDLGQRFLWADCTDPKYVSSARRRLLCTAPQCSLIQTPFSCADNTSSCTVLLDNPFSAVSTIGDLSLDSAAFISTDGSKPGPLVTLPGFIFACASTTELKGLARGAKGIAGFGRNRIALPLQLAAAFRLHPVFAMCLSSSPSYDGAIFFGNGPYTFQFQKVFGPDSFAYTPLIVNRVSTSGAYYKGEKSVEYFIGIKSIKIIDRVVPLNATLLSIDRQGNGGTKISTATPYTTLQTSIHDALINTFASTLSKIKRVPAVGKFKLCYNANSFSSTRVGYGVPQIDLVMQNEKAIWSIFGANSMIEAKPGVACLAFVDGGAEPRTSIVIGGYQIEDNLLLFDLKNGRLGFTSSLLFYQTTCANFNWTSNN